MIQVNRLEGFYHVVRTGSYAAAAREFPYPITQPAVHQQVKKLEGELGCSLLERVGKARMHPTPAGKVLFDFIEPFFAGLPSVEQAIRGQSFGGTLRIHTSGLVLRQLLPGWLKRLQRSRPDVSVDLHEMEAPDLDLLLRGDTDLLVDHLPEVPESVATATVAAVAAFLVVPADHAVAKRARISLRDLAGETFVGYTPGLLAHDLQMRVLEDHQIKPPRFVYASSADTILGFVESGLGFSLVPSLEERGPRGRGFVARALAPRRLRFPIYAAWRRLPPNPLVEAAMEVAPANG
jgi:DNA-binding transcriptional LysR family regulator